MIQQRSNRVYPIKRGDDEKEGQSFSDFKELHKRKGEITKESIFNKMSRFTLMFFASEMEEDFQHWHTQRSRASAVLAIFVLLLFEGLTGILDLTEGLSDTSFRRVIMLRYAGICPVLFMLGIMSLSRCFRNYMQIGTCISCALVGCILVAQLTIVIEETHVLYAYGLNFLAHFIPLLVYTFSISKLLFPYAVASVIVYLVGVVVIVTYYAPTGASVFLISIVCIAVMLSVVNRNAEMFLRRSHAIDQIVEQEREKIRLEKQLSESLLLNIFPKVIAHKFTRNQNMFQHFENVTIFFSDIVGFTEISAKKEPKDLVAMLDELFVRIDDLVRKYNVEKIKTIGDAYICAAGLPVPNARHAQAMADLSLEVLEAIEQFNISKSSEKPIQIRIGLHTGSCIAGVVGKHKYIYDLYGEGPTMANAMESTGHAGKIQVSPQTYELLRNEYILEERNQPMDFKGTSIAQTYFLIQKRPPAEVIDPVVPIEIPPSPQKAPFEKPSFEKQGSAKLDKQLAEKAEKEKAEKEKAEKEEKPERPTFEKPVFEKQGSRNLELPGKRASVTYERTSNGVLRGIRSSRSFERLQKESSSSLELNLKESSKTSPTKAKGVSFQVSDDPPGVRRASLPMVELGASVIVGGSETPREFQIGMENPIYKHLQQDINQILGTIMYHVSCKFDVKAIETEYQKLSLDRDRLQLKIGLAFIIVIAVATDLYLTQSLFLVDRTYFTHFHLIWYLVLVFPYVVVFVTTFFPWFAFLSRLVITMVNITGGAAVVAVGFINNYLWTGLVVAYLANFLLIKVQFMTTLLTCLIIHLAINVVVFVVRGAQWIDIAFFLWSAFISAALAAYFLERMARAAYLKEKLLEKEEESLRVQQSKSEELLANLLPISVAHKLKSGQTNIASRYANATFMFAHVVGFSKLQEELEMDEMFKNINKIFCKLDDLTTTSKMEKIKSIGMTYFVAGGIPTFSHSHHREVATLALNMQQFMEKYKQETGLSVSLRIGINVGSCVAGVIGNRKWTYDLWGDDVNIASRMESSCPPGRIQVSKNAYRYLKPFFEFEKRGVISVKGKGDMKTYFLVGMKPPTPTASQVVVLDDPMSSSYTPSAPGTPVISPENVIFRSSHDGLLNSVR